MASKLFHISRFPRVRSWYHWKIQYICKKTFVVVVVIVVVVDVDVVVVVDKALNSFKSVIQCKALQGSLLCFAANT